MFAELALRPFGYGSYVLYGSHAELLWLPEPNQRGVTVAGHQPITINDASLRWSQPGVPTAVGFGDSVTMGWGVADDDTFSARLGMASAGVNAWPTSLCVDRFEALAPQLDEAVLAYSFNNRMEAVIASDDKEGFLRGVRLKNAARRLALYNFVVEDLLRRAVYHRVKEDLVDGTWARGGERLENNQTRVREALHRALDVADQHGIALTLLVLGSAGQTSPGPFQQIWLDVAAERDATLVDMTGMDPALFQDHVHPVPEGHRLIAEALAQSGRP